MNSISQEVRSRLRNLANNRKPIRFSSVYLVNGEEACRETFILRRVDKSGYVVGHDDCLERFIDIPDLHFKYERFEFEDFNNALDFAINNYGLEENDFL